MKVAKGIKKTPGDAPTEEDRMGWNGMGQDGKEWNGKG